MLLVDTMVDSSFQQRVVRFRSPSSQTLADKGKYLRTPESRLRYSVPFDAFSICYQNDLNRLKKKKSKEKSLYKLTRTIMIHDE